MTTDVYAQYFSAECVFSSVPRRAALVSLTVDSEAGSVRYTVSATFFPHRDEEDFGVSYDAYVSRVVYEGAGRRSKKRESALLETVRATVDGLSSQLSATVFWDKPLREARRG